MKNTAYINEDLCKVLDRMNIQEMLYHQKISCNVVLRFKDLTVSVEYMDNYRPPKNFPIPQPEFGSYVFYPIDEVFDCFYELYSSFISTFDLEEKDGITSPIALDKKLLNKSLMVLSDNHHRTGIYVDLINNGSYNGHEMIFRRNFSINLLKLANSDIGNDTDNNTFGSIINNCGPFIYYCINLYQVCFAFIDYLFKYPYPTYTKKYSMKRCPYCGKHFLTDNKKIKYCSRTVIDGLTCAERKESERKKSYIPAPKNDIQKLEQRIRNRLRSYKNYETSFNKNDFTPSEVARRNDIYSLWLAKNNEVKGSDFYKSWLVKCIAKMDEKGGEKYEIFFKWLKEME